MARIEGVFRGLFLAKFLRVLKLLQRALYWELWMDGESRYLVVIVVYGRATEPEG